MIELELLKDEYSIYKFSPDFDLIDYAKEEAFFSLTKTKDELSAVAKENTLSGFIKEENGWKILKINGILDFSLTGILSKISSVLADENISIFVISTFNTDYIMIKNENINKAVNALRKSGYSIIV
ncbi:MAG: ACT domain-containing protein [Treponema sp.]|nr:ACT domain-containing protein [Treponema sp.]